MSKIWWIICFLHMYVSILQTRTIWLFPVHAMTLKERHRLCFSSSSFCCQPSKHNLFSFSLYRTKCSILGGRAPRLLTRRRGRIDYPSSIWPPSKSTETWNSAFTSEESASANLHLPPSFCPSLLFLLLLLLITPLSIQPTHHSFFFPPSSRKLPSSVSSSSSSTLLHILGLSGADSSSTDVA